MQIALHNRQDLQELQDRIRRERNAKQRDRCRAVLLAIEGNQTKTIMEMLGRSKNFVQRWSYAYRDSGIDAIAPGRPSGRPSKLTEIQEKQFCQRMLKGPRQGDGVCSLRAKDARRIIEQESGVHYSLPGVYDLLHRLGFSCLRPRPKHRKNDPQRCKNGLNKPPFCPNNPRKTTRQNHRDMVSRRVQSRPTGNPDTMLGADGFTANGHFDRPSTSGLKCLEQSILSQETLRHC